jgi:glutathione S-transferase
MYCNSVIEPAMAGTFANAPASAGAHGRGSFDLMIGVLRDGHAAGPWILGERFRAAGALLGTACHFMRQFKAVDSDPVLFGCADRCLARPSARRAMALETG